MNKDIYETIAKGISARRQQVVTAVDLLDGGASVPFVARYRKEATGGLSDEQLRNLESQLEYLRDLEQRRKTILKSIREQEKLTPEIERMICAAATKTALEDLYLPFKPKRHSKAQLAREAGLEPLVKEILQHPEISPETQAIKYIDTDKNLPDSKTALLGARQILMEKMMEAAGLLDRLREKLWREGVLHSKASKSKQAQGAKFRDYFDYSERIGKIPPHRSLALFRGRQEKILTLKLRESATDKESSKVFSGLVAGHFDIHDRNRPADPWLLETVQLGWKTKLLPRLESDLFARLKDLAEEDAIRVFSKNLKNLLLAAPAGRRPTIGLDPGLRTGVKVAVVDATGKLLETSTIFPHPPRKQWGDSIKQLTSMIASHGVDLVSIGNGTGSRETERLMSDLMGQNSQTKITKVTVSEAGASVYSASEAGTKEFPKLDVSLRGAVSIARRLQDPLAELVKIEPKSIGVGQYQHDVAQNRLSKSLENVVEDCVNAVGVDVNTASAWLLKHVSGLNQGIGENIVEFRNQNGPFVSRENLKSVPRLGHKTFQQAAGFLRIMNGGNPLDASAVHPEAYPLVEKIMQKTGKTIDSFIGKADFLNSLAANDYVDDQFGLPTVKDILAELEKPGRDPRPEFKRAAFEDGIESIADLVPGMRLNGIVTNVTSFGAFIDIGVHQDGLAHISQLADHFVKDPHEVVKAGDAVSVTVLEIDTARRRISLSMKTSQQKAPSKPKTSEKPIHSKKRNDKSTSKAITQSALADAFKRALEKQ